LRTTGCLSQVDFSVLPNLLSLFITHSHISPSGPGAVLKTPHRY
jgi:hypothetical protein